MAPKNCVNQTIKINKDYTKESKERQSKTTRELFNVVTDSCCIDHVDDRLVCEWKPKNIKIQICYILALDRAVNQEMNLCK